MSILLNKGVNLNTITTTDRNALTGVATGTVIYNSTVNSIQSYNGSNWRDISYTGPAFRAYSSAGIANLTQDTYTKVPLNVEDFDTNSNFDNVTNYRFTPTVAGYYQVSGGAYFALQGTDWRFAGVLIYKNGVVAALQAGPPFNGNSISTSVSSLLYLNGTTDYIELYVVAQSTTPGATKPLLGGTENTFMSACFVRQE
jgi:hypothetical protein